MALLLIRIALYSFFNGYIVHCFSSVIRNEVTLFNLVLDQEIPYSQSWRWQHALMEKQILQQDSTCQLSPSGRRHVGHLIALQHKSVYTLGTATTEGSGPFSKVLLDGSRLEYDTFHVERAGQATYHGPGQIVLYPIMDLSNFGKDINCYLRKLEDVVINTAKHYGVSAGRVDGLTGVWVGDSKIAAIGIKLRRWVTMHGLSLNVQPDMRYFENIIPCGISDKSVGSLHDINPSATVDNVLNVMLLEFSKVFDIEYRNDIPSEVTTAYLDKLASNFESSHNQSI
jgi:lipoyl(octanoyl) transferase